MSRREWREAEELASRGRWEEAGGRFAALAERAERVQDRRLAREAATQAADAFRRDDRPASAAKMLRLARACGKDDPTDYTQLAAVLLDAGQVEAAVDIARDARERAHDPAEATLALDTLTGLYLVQGRLDEARACLDQLAALALPGSLLSRRFRTAQVDRLDGLVGAAETAWLGVTAELAPHPAAAGPEGATWAELGEIDLLRSAFSTDPGHLCARAIERFDRALACWTKAGRRAGIFRAEAWAARARAVAGATVVAPQVDRAIAYAVDRGLPFLEADLRACRAVIRRDPDDLLHAIDRLGEAPLARGRARVLRVELGAPADLELALHELAPDGPWTARALRALGKERSDPILLEEAAERARAWA